MQFLIIYSLFGFIYKNLANIHCVNISAAIRSEILRVEFSALDIYVVCLQGVDLAYIDMLHP